MRAGDYRVAGISLVVLGVLAICGMTLEGRREREIRQYEQVHAIDLNNYYQLINWESFEGKLPTGVEVTWRKDLGGSEGGDYVGLTDFDKGWPPKIYIDSIHVRSEEHLLKVMRHEMCHVQSWEVVTRTPQDVHGDAFQICMARFHYN
jgi:predicted SprT family Zn-dependent metalloprotease